MESRQRTRWALLVLTLVWLQTCTAFVVMPQPSEALTFRQALATSFSSSSTMREASLTTGGWESQEASRRPPSAGTAVQIRQATEKDFPKIAQSRQAVIILARNQGRGDDANPVVVRGVTKRDMLARIPGLLSGDSIAFIGVCGRGEEVVASVDVSLRPARGFQPYRLWVKNMYVAPDFRRRGVAGRLLDAIAAHARRVGVNYIFLEVLADNVAAQRLYEEYGFRYVDRGFEPLMRALGMGRVEMYMQVF